MAKISKFELRLTSSVGVSYLDIVIDNHPLVTYFAVLRRAIPNEVSPLGGPSTEQHNRQQFRRFLLEEPPDLPGGRNSILLCGCGDLACGAYSAIFTREGELIRWSEFGYESTLGEEISTPEIPTPSLVPTLLFSWEQYEAELRRRLTGV